MSVHLYKYNYMGKEYLIYDTAKYPVLLTEEAIRKICDRNHSSGSDGLLAGPYFTEKGMTVHMYDADGSDAANEEAAARILSRYLRDRKHCTGRFFLPDCRGQQTGDEEIYFVGGMILSDTYIRRNQIGCPLSA